jgi:TolB-like protein
MTERRREFEIEGEPIPPVWEEWLAACLAKDPVRRPQSVMEIARRLQMPSPEARPPSVGSFFERPKKKILIPVTLAALCVIAGGTWYLTKSKLHTKAEAMAANAPSQAATMSEKSIAVLPFENRSEDKQNAYFADGVQDEILTDLAKVADLKVISRTSVMQYRSGAERNVREIAQQLGVAHVVEGSVQRSGNRVRVNAQLIDARTDEHLWGQTYDRDLADIL